MTLFELLANWDEGAQPCAPICVGDISSAENPGLPDCAVDMFDVMTLLAGWGECQ